MRYFILLLFIILFTMPCLSQTTVDTIIASDVPLTGNISTFNADTIPMVRFYINLSAGDCGMPWIPPYYSNRTSKAYLTFDLSELSGREIIDSICVGLRTTGAMIWGNHNNNTWPIWDVEGGDTVKLVVDHIDFGDYLTTAAWTAGDEGDTMTIESDIAFIEFADWNSETDEFVINLTDAVLNDISSDRDKTQIRISFQIDTDYDDAKDSVTFYFGQGGDYHYPKLYIYIEQKHQSMDKK